MIPRTLLVVVLLAGVPAGASAQRVSERFDKSHLHADGPPSVVVDFARGDRIILGGVVGGLIGGGLGYFASTYNRDCPADSTSCGDTDWHLVLSFAGAGALVGSIVGWLVR